MLRTLFFSTPLAGRVLTVPSICRITTSSFLHAKQLPPRPPPINEDDITESFLKGSGPGGQKINKTSSAVQLKHIPTGMVVKVQATRSRSQNRTIARRALAERLEELEKGDQSRIAIVGEIKKKRKRSAVKKSKRKYRLREAAKNAGTNEDNSSVSSQGSKGKRD